jgi:hypothetical protein
MKARIRWKTREEGGREAPPIGARIPHYIRQVRFTDSPEPHGAGKGEYDLILEPDASLSEEYVWIAEVRFVTDEGRKGELRPGRGFELYDGWQCVATGTLIG